MHKRVIFTGASILIAALVVSLLSCANRDRLNPFDPEANGIQNAFNLHLKSDQNSVTLNWSPVDSPDLTGYNIYRSHPGESLQKIAGASSDIHEYTDLTISLNQDYVYAITALGKHDESPYSRLDTITPGRSRWWVLSANFNPVDILTHDGLHLFSTTSTEYYAPEFILPASRITAYIYDQLGGTIYRQDIGEEPRSVVEGIGLVRNLIYNTKSGQIVAIFSDQNRNMVDFINPITRVKQQVALDTVVTAMTVDSRGDTWVATATALKLISWQTKRVIQSVPLGIRDQVVALEMGPDNRPLFLTSTGTQIYQISNENQIEPFLAVDKVLGLRYDSDNATLWIRAYNPDSKTYQILQYTGSHFQEVLGGLEQAYTFEVNPVSHVCLVPDYNTETLYAIQPDGAVRSRKHVAGKIYYLVAQSLEL